MSPLGKATYALIKVHKDSLNPSKYKWKIDKKKDNHHEMIEATVYHRQTNAKVLFIVGSKAVGQNNYSLSVNFFADNV